MSTLAAWCTASTAMSAPELPQPTTSTRWPVNTDGERYCEECSTVPANSPGSCGSRGVCRVPEATSRPSKTRVRCSPSCSVTSSQPASCGRAETTRVPSS